MQVSYEQTDLSYASWNGQGELARKMGQRKVISGSDKPNSLSLTAQS